MDRAPPADGAARSPSPLVTPCALHRSCESSSRLIPAEANSRTDRRAAIASSSETGPSKLGSGNATDDITAPDIAAPNTIAATLVSTRESRRNQAATPSLAGPSRRRPGARVRERLLEAFDQHQVALDGLCFREEETPLVG